MKLIKNMGLSTVYQLLSLIVPLITAPYVSRVLGSTGVGINAFTASILSYFTLFAGLGIQIYGNREIAYHQNNVRERTKIFWELQIIQTISTLISIVVFLIFLIFQSKYQIFFLIQGISLFTVMANISWFFMGLENFQIIVFRNTLINLIVVILTFLLVRKYSDLWIYILLLVGANLLANLSVWPFLKKEICKISIRDLDIKKHMGPVLILLLPQIAATAYVNINKTMLGWLDSTSGVGYFNQADMIIRTAFTAVSSFASAFLPRLSNLFSENKIEEGKNLIRTALQIMFTLSILAIAGILGVSNNFATFFFGEKFQAVGPLMAVEAFVIFFFGIANVIRSQYLMAIRHTREITVAALIALIVNIIINLIMIPRWGVMGATITVLITEGLTTAYLVWAVRKDFDLVILFQGFWKYIIAGIVAFGGTYYLNNNLNPSIISYIIQAFGGIITYSIMIFILKAPILKLFKDFKKSKRSI